MLTRPAGKPDTSWRDTRGHPGRFPVTLYKEQWLRLLDMTDDIRNFIQENDSKLKGKS